MKPRLMKHVNKTGIHVTRRPLSWIVTLLAVGGLAYWGVVAARQYFVNPTNERVAANPQQPQRDPTVHDFSDADYAGKMLLYHQLAAQIADIAKEKATRADVRLIAAQYSAQESQRAEFYSKMLISWNEPFANLTDFPEINGCNGYPTFSGMLPHPIVSAYRNSTGIEIDEQFLELSITHHQGLNALINENGRSVGYGALLEARDNTLQSQDDEIKRLNTVRSGIRT